MHQFIPRHTESFIASTHRMDSWHGTGYRTLNQCDMPAWILVICTEWPPKGTGARNIPRNIACVCGNCKIFARYESKPLSESGCYLIPSCMYDARAVACQVSIECQDRFLHSNAWLIHFKRGVHYLWHANRWPRRRLTNPNGFFRFWNNPAMS